MKILYNSSASAIYHMMIEEDIERIMKSPFTSIASDGSAVTYQEGVPHLRNYGTYPRVLGKYVREQGVLSLEEAIYKMTKLPAQSMKLKTRGTLAEGMTADINIFNPVTVSDHYDWPNPHQYATGFSYVIVNGVPVIDRNKRTSEFPGAVLRRGD
jgi:N-acyl-D-amino-acid deacylase